MIQPKHNVIYEHFWDVRSIPSAWASENNEFGAHFHSSFEFIYQRSGTTYALLDGQPYTLCAGDLLMISGSVVHASTSGPGSSIYVLIVPLPAVPYLQSALSGKAFDSPILHSCLITAEIVHCIEAMLPYRDHCKIKNSCYTYDSYIESALIKGYAYTFMSLLIHEVGLHDLQSSRSTMLVQEILVYLQNNYKEQISLDSLCLQFGYSRSRFSHIFNSYFGCSLNRYLNILRCQQIEDELETDHKLDITDAALNCGFGSVRSFYRMYRELYGHSPRQELA